MKSNTTTLFWREWGPPVACILLTLVGLYGLWAFANIPFINLLLFALALGCPLAVGLIGWLYRKA